MTTQELDRQLKELQAEEARYYKAKSRAILDFERSGKISDIDFFKSVLKFLKLKDPIEAETDTDLNAELLWVGIGEACIIKYKDKWIVDSNGFDTNLDKTLNDPACKHKVFDTRMEAAYGMNRLLADRKMYSFQNDFEEEYIYF